ncbi:patatin-like phospholipase family protein [Brevundimonas sp. NPDC092305]|uniref:patatin-like phospholipase family protein n=1 Tax=Brevundimonas sp. NPDC092305 TaxID=3363957 RepID=UPI0038271FEE
MTRLLPAALAAALLVAGCQSVGRAAYSRDALHDASPVFRLESGAARDRARFVAEVTAAAAAPTDGAFDLLALSSGGANGAYGAGVLVGWSERGDRPVFEVVTGVSIGALMAPWAFIGASRDADLEAAFTDGRTEHLLKPRWAGAVIQPGLYQTGPLRALVSRAVDDRLLDEVARGHREGRRLYVATTSMDTREQVIWDLGALAASGRPDARDLFIDILTAASSVPGAFAPVPITLETKTGLIREVHADGRLTANFFVAPETVLDGGQALFRPDDLAAPGRIWVIVNGSPEEAFRIEPYSNVSLIGRALEAMLNAATRLSLIATRQFAQLNGLELSVTTSGPYGADRPFDFDRDRMVALFRHGRASVRDHGGWKAAAKSEPV